MEDHIKNIIKSIESIRGKYDKWTIFSDFVAIAAISIRNSIDIIGREEREEQYFQIIKKYTEGELNIFAKMLAEIVQGLEKDPSDILGQVFMELDISNKWQGQFFTPMSISNLMSELTVAGIEEHIASKGYITLDEPAAGGGAMIIGFAKAMKKRGFNYQTQLYVNARDLDIKAVQMCYIQLSLLGMPANVQHGDTITLKIHDEWKTPFHILNRWEYRIRRDEEDKETKTLFKEDETGQLKLA